MIQSIRPIGSLLPVASLFSLFLFNAFGDQSVLLSSLDLKDTQQEWGSPHANQSVAGNSLTIGGKRFETGLGTHATSLLRIKLGGNAREFTAWVGVDDEEIGQPGMVIFSIIGDGKTLWKSGIMKSGDAAKFIAVNVSGVDTLVLRVGNGGSGINFDHADWANASFDMIQGLPEAVPPPPPEPAVILTPQPGPQPKINGPKVYGCRPEHPFLYIVPVTGIRPVQYFARGLPRGLKLNSKTGIITGSIKERGEYDVTFRAKNSLGTAKRQFRIICGDQIALTPPMGWNSWNCFASAVTENKVKAASDAMVASGLINHGWTYINVDDFWQVNRNSDDPSLRGPRRNALGCILPNPRFPDMSGLAEYIHSKGLKAGLYSSPGPWTCGGCVGSWQHERQDAQQYADWGFDYLKYDWCSYGDVVHGSGSAYYQKPYLVMREALNALPRDIVFSFCQYGMGDVWKWGAQAGGNSWRTTDDISDTWQSMSRNGFSQDALASFAGPGHWNDPDMLVVGDVGWGPSLHPTHLTPNEQYTHISLWCLLSAPLLIGCDMTKLDAFTLNLLSNDEVLAVDQDSLGRQASRVSQQDTAEIWSKDLSDGSKAVGLFNRGEDDQIVTAKWSDLGISGEQMVHDLWRQKDLGKSESDFKTVVPRHGVVLVRIGPVK